jgi:hypothetical protein
MLERTKLSCAELRPYFESILDHLVRDKTWSDAWRAEYFALSSFIDDFSQGRVNGQFIFGEKQRPPRGLLRFMLKPNQTRRFLAEACRSFRDGQADRVRKRDIPGWPPTNVLGKTLVNLMMGSDNDSMWKTRRTTDFSIIVLRVLFALRCFKEANGKLPESLAELVPQHLKEVPADPFDGKPIRYSPEKRLIYSIGRDRIDSGGLVPKEGEGRSGDDPTYKFEL